MVRKKEIPTRRLHLSRDLPVAAVSPSEAEAMYGISRSVLYLHLRSGRLRSSKVGSRRIIRIIDLETFLDSLTG